MLQQEITDMLQSQGRLLARIEQLLTTHKDTLTLGETAIYTNISKSYLYKLTSSNSIPHYKPEGKMIYFDRLELDAWLKRNRIKTVQEIEEIAMKHTIKRGKH